MFKVEATQTEIEYNFEYKKVWLRQQTAGMNKLVNVLVITDLSQQLILFKFRATAQFLSK